MKWNLHLVFLVAFLKNFTCEPTSLYLYLSTVLHEQISDPNVAEPICAKIMSDQVISQFQEDRIFKEAISEEQLWQHVWKYSIAQWNVIGLCLFLAHRAIMHSKSDDFSKFPFINKAMTMAEPLKSGVYYPGPIEWLAKFVSDNFPFLSLLLTRPNKSFRNRALCKMAKNQSHGFKYFPEWMTGYYNISNCETFYIPMNSNINISLVDSVREGDLSDLHLYSVNEQVVVAAIYSGYNDFDKFVYPPILLKDKDFEEEAKRFYDSPLRRWPLNIVNAFAMKKIPYLDLRLLFLRAIRNSDWQVTEKFIDYEDKYLKDFPNNIPDNPNAAQTEFGNSILDNISESLFTTVVKEGQNRLARFMYSFPNGRSFNDDVIIYRYSHDLLLLEHHLQHLKNYDFASDLSISLKHDALVRKTFNLEKYELFAKNTSYCPEFSAVESVLEESYIDKLSRIKLINFVLNQIDHVHLSQRKEYSNISIGNKLMLQAVRNDEGEILKLKAKQVNSLPRPDDIAYAIEFCSLNYIVTGVNLKLIKSYFLNGDLLAACQKIKYKISDEIANLPLLITPELINFGAENAILPFIRRGLKMNPEIFPKEDVMQKMVTYRHIEIWEVLMMANFFPTEEIIKDAAKTGIIPLIELLKQFNRHSDQEIINSIASNNYDSFSVKETILPDNCNEMILLQVDATHPMDLASIKEKSELECILKKYGNAIINQKVVNDAALIGNYLLLKYSASIDRPVLPHSENLRKSNLSPYQKKDLADILAYKGNFEAIYKFSDSKDDVRGVLYAYFTKDVVEAVNFIKSFDQKMNRSEKIAEFALLRENERVLNYLFLGLERPIFPPHSSFDRLSDKSKVIMAKIAKNAIAFENMKVVNFFATLDSPIFNMEIFSKLFEQLLLISKEKKNCIYQDSFLGLSYDKNNDNKKVSFTESTIKSSLYIERIINENQISYGYTSIHETLKVEFRRNEVKIYYTGSTLGILIFFRKKESIETIFDSMWRNSPEEVIISLEGDLKVGLEDNLMFVVGYKENYSKISKIDAEGVFNLGDNSSFNDDIENFHKLAIKAHEAKTNFWNVNKWNEGKGLYAAVLCLHSNDQNNLSHSI